MKFWKITLSMILMSCVLVSSMIFPNLTNATSNTTAKADQKESGGQVVERDYNSVLKEWEQKGEDSGNYSTTVSPKQFKDINAKQLKTGKSTKGYSDSVFYWHSENEIKVNVDVPKEGLYEIKVDYFPLGDGSIPIEGSVKTNGTIPFFEAKRIIFDTYWTTDKKTFEQDKRGNDIPSDPIVHDVWRTMTMRDAAYLEAEPLQFYLQKGKNEIVLKNERGEALIGNVTVHTSEKMDSYKDYQANNESKVTKNQLLTVEGESVKYRNNSYNVPLNFQDPNLVPYNSKQKRINAFGGEGWSKSGQNAIWEFEVKESGYYNISLKVLQNLKNDSPVFRTIKIDDKLLFEDLKAYPFSYAKKWTNTTLRNKKGENFSFYLKKGVHTMSLEVDATPMDDMVSTLETLTNEMSDLSLELKKLTGNNQDMNRDWDVVEYIPDIQERIASWIKTLEEQITFLQNFNTKKKSTSDMVTLKECIDSLQRLAEEPNKIPTRLTELTEGTGSISQRLLDLSMQIQFQPLTIDRIYIHSEDQSLPKPTVGIGKKITESVKQFMLSFSDNQQGVKEEIDVWVNRPRKYVELLQDMADKTFTPKSGIKVNFSIMPDENKLILANAAGTQPDVALGVSTNIPYELAIRGAALDLREFDDFGKVIGSITPGAMLPYIIEESVYGIPETQDFYVMYYREDILNKLGIPIPNTWDEVLEILPELQMYGMNFHTPLDAAGSFKPFMATAPFIYQHGGDLYQENGMGTAINSEEALNGIKFMSDLFTVYSLPLQTPNFYNHFRYGKLPIGVAPFATYVQLSSAAPEIANSWKIAPQPGVKNKDGVVERWAAGSAQSSMIFKETEKKDASWELVKWWQSEDVQVEFANQLQMLFGPEYLWHTANLDAFERLAWPEEHKKVILEQWEWLREVPKTPAAYMLEREISNIWNKIVFNGENPRVAIDSSINTINREVNRKMEEFGYMKDGKIVKEYPIPTIELVESWVEE